MKLERNHDRQNAVGVEARPTATRVQLSITSARAGDGMLAVWLSERELADLITMLRYTGKEVFGHDPIE